MNVSPAAMVSATLDMQQAQTREQSQVALFKKTLDIAESNMATLLQALPANPPLATSGNLGTRLNTYA